MEMRIKELRLDDIQRISNEQLEEVRKSCNPSDLFTSPLGGNKPK